MLALACTITCRPSAARRRQIAPPISPLPPVEEAPASPGAWERLLIKVGAKQAPPTQAELEDVEARIRALNPQVTIHRTVNCNVPIAEVLSSYIDTVLRHRRDEATLMGPPTETVSIPIITGAVDTRDEDDDVDWRDLV